MMNTKRSFLVLVLFVIFQRSDQRVTSELTETARQKRMAQLLPYDAFSDKINDCLFHSWSRYNKKNPTPGLSELVDCKGSNRIGLCYGPPPADVNVERVAQYAACYNTKTLIPEFTGHIVLPNIAGQGRPGDWKSDNSIEPNKVATDQDYSADQWKLYKNYDSQKQQFFARGHLTPNADFTTNEQREYTMITTNIAPQWQLFNAGNWESMETALRNYATKTERALYVFTGTGGAATNFQGNDIKLNGKVVAPRWFWKAVCDPTSKQSVLFYGENTIGEMGGMEGQKEKGCYGKVQTKRLGVIKCFSLEDAKKAGLHFKIPKFDVDYCVPSKIGEIFKPYIESALE